MAIGPVEMSAESYPSDGETIQAVSRSNHSLKPRWLVKPRWLLKTSRVDAGILLWKFAPLKMLDDSCNCFETRVFVN